MLTKIVYNCTPESLDEIDQAAFVDAFENEVRVKPLYQDLQISVTFNSGKSGITTVAVDDDDYPEPANYNDEFAYFAEKAFAACTITRKPSDYAVIEKPDLFGPSSWFISGPDGAISQDYPTREEAQAVIDNFDFTGENERLAIETEKFLGMP